MLSKVFVKTLQSTVSKALLKNKQTVSTVYRAFATTEVARIDKGKTKLTKAIAREIKFEQENYQKDDSVNVF